MIQETATWSEGVELPPESVKQYTYSKSYLFTKDSGTNTETTTDPLGNISSKTYVMRIKSGPLVQQISPLGFRETLKYDLFGRPTEVIDALGSSTKTSYSLGPNQNFMQNTTSWGYTVRTTYDALGREISVADSGNQGSTDATRTLSQTKYDQASRMISSTNELGLTKTQIYDALGRVTKGTDEVGNVTTYEFDDPGLTMNMKLNGDLRATTVSDALGRQCKTITYGDSEAPGNSYRLVSEQSYDGFGSVISNKDSQQSTQDSSNKVLSQRTVMYDAQDQPYKIVSSSLPSDLQGSMDSIIREFQFDIFGNTVTYKKTVSYADGRRYVHKGPLSIFDAGSRLTGLKNQLGQTEINEFDADGRLTTMTRYDGTKHHYTYDQIGQLLTLVSPDGSQTNGYLPNGRLASVTRAGASIRHTYALDGSIRTTQYPDGQTQTYVLDDFSRVVQEIDASGQSSQNSFDAYGRIASKELKQGKTEYEFGTVNHSIGHLVGRKVFGSQTYHRSETYDGFGRRMQTKDQDTDGKVIMNALYLYNSRSRLIAHEVSSEKYPETPSVNKKESFQYDGLGQLVLHSKQYDRNLAAPQIKQFKFDGNFNMIQKITNDITESLAYNELDQRTDSGFTYDENGRLVHDAGGRNYNYDSQDRLLSVNGPQYPSATVFSYNPDDSLAGMSKDRNSNTFYYSCGAVNASCAKAGSQPTWTSYLIDPKGPVISAVGETENTVLIESRNSITMTLGDGKSSTYDYGDYGKETSASPNADFRIGWQQELCDTSHGLTYLRSRYNQANNMSFITMDSYRSQENRYAYCYGNPVNGTDGTGHEMDPATLGAIGGALVGIAVTVASGGALSWLGASFTGLSMAQIGVGAATISGALGSVASDAASAAIQGQSLSLARAGEDLLVGAVGGAVGAGSGGLASSAAARMALSAQMSRVAIVRIGVATSCVVGGGMGGVAQSGTSAALHHESLFSTNTALAALFGAVSGAAGAFIAGGAALALGRLPVIPVELTEAEIGLIKPGVVPRSSGIESSKIFAMSTRQEMADDFDGITRSLLETAPGKGEHFTIIAHGEAGRMYATVK